MATPATRLNGVQLPKQATTPVVATNPGVWSDNTATPNLRYDDGTNSNFVAAIPATTKGDLAVFNGTNWVRLGVGSDTNVLTADSTQASGIKWAAGGGGASTGNYTFSTNTMDLSGAATASLFTGTANGANMGSSAFGTFQLTAARMLIAQRALTTGSQQSALAITGGAHTALTASTEQFDINFNLARTVQFSTGALTTQRAFIVQPPTYAFVGSSTITNAYSLAITGAPKAGTNATLTNTSALGIFTGADAAHGLTFVPNSATQTGNMWRSLDASGNVLSSLQVTDSGQSNLLSLTSQLNGGYTFLHASTVGGALDMQMNSGILLMAGGASDFRFYSSSFGTQLANIQASGVHSNRFAPLATQNLSFSATPAFDPTAGNVIHIGTITGNVTGPTMVSGQAGEKCTIIFQKDATAGTYTITTSWGTNVRMNSTAIAFTATASTCIIINFVWDDRLSTPQWVETGRVGPI